MSKYATTRLPAMVDLSIVIPTFNEKNNLTSLLRRITNSLKNIDIKYDIWFVDDSTDDTPEVLATLKEKHNTVNFIHRNNIRGLGTAVVTGFNHCNGEMIIVMDADLQHPPELLPEIISNLHNTDIVIPSRFITCGSDGGLNYQRKTISWIARNISKFLIKDLENISDCTSGFFGLHKSILKNVDLTPTSWKILIEVLVKTKHKKPIEIPYTFNARDAGESKLNIQEQWNFFKHLWALRQFNKKINSK